MIGLESAAPGSSCLEVGLLAEVRAGMAARPRRLPPRWLLDARGLALHDALVGAPEHYLPRAEEALRERHRAELAALATPGEPRLPFLSGARLGELEPADLVDLLRGVRAGAAPGARLAAGLDLPKAGPALVRAYQDAGGAAEALHLHGLARLNRELGAGLDLAAFRYAVSWEPARSRVERWLVCGATQVLRLGGEVHVLEPGEGIHVASAYKWEPRAFDTLAALAGWTHVRTFTDARAWYALKVFERG